MSGKRLSAAGIIGMRYVVGALALLILGGCTPVTLRDQAPLYSWVAKRDFEASIACVVDNLDASIGTLVPNVELVPHRVVVQEPDMIVKITPSVRFGTHKPYWVRLMVLSERETVVDLYTYPENSPEILAVLRPCL